MTDTDVEIATATAMAALGVFNYLYKVNSVIKKKPRRKRRWWLVTMHRNRTEQTMENMFTEMLYEPSGEFQNFCRMSLTDFEFLLCKIGPKISKRDTDWRKAIPAKVRLAVTLRFLATGDSYRSLHYLFKISSQIISMIVPEVCDAINDALKEQVKLPSTEEEWLLKEKGFSSNFPHCLGAIDGKHIVIEAPAHSGSEYYNYKRSFSIVLLALVDSDFCFMFADIGSHGRISDGGVFRNTDLWKNLSAGRSNLPSPRPLPGCNTEMPYVFLGDGAFALSEYLMKPYPGKHETNSPKRIFNHRLSSSRVVVENVFGIMAAVFRVFKKPMLIHPNTVLKVTMSCVLLHNFLRRSETSRNLYTPPGTLDTYENGRLLRPGSWRQNEGTLNALRPMCQVARKPPLNALQIRDNFTAYFSENNVLRE